MRIWLSKYRDLWVDLVRWLDEESYEPSLNGNRYNLTRQKSAEETIQRLAATGSIKLKPLTKKLKGSAIYDDNNNATFGWQGIKSCKTKTNDHMYSTDATTSILLSPCPENGTLTEIRILMGCLDFEDAKEKGYSVHIYESITNNMKENIQNGTDTLLYNYSKTWASKFDPVEVKPQFHVGDTVTCSCPHQDQENDNPPKTGYVLARRFDQQQSTYLYNLKYNDGTSDFVQEFLLSVPDGKDASHTNGNNDLLAFKLISSTKINKVMTSSTCAHGYSLNIPIRKGQYVGIHHKSGCLDIYCNPIWPKNEPNEFRYAFARGKAPKCTTKGFVEYNAVRSDLRVWGFATTIRYDSEEMKNPILNRERQEIVRYDRSNGNGRHFATSASGLSEYGIETSSDDDNNFDDWNNQD
jgi:hypothetical protein